MFSMLAILMFAGALAAAAYAVCATVLPALPKIQAALAGKGTTQAFPPLPPRRVATLRVMAQPVASQQTYWRAAA